MKKKTSSPSLIQIITLKWVTRYFILHADGKLVYYRDSNLGKEELLCTNVADCNIERVNAADVDGRADYVNNSFYITAPGGGKRKRNLLVTHGPEDFKRWIRQFRKMKAKMIGGVDRNVQEIEIAPKHSTTEIAGSMTIKEVTKEEKAEESAIPKEIELSAEEDITQDTGIFTENQDQKEANDDISPQSLEVAPKIKADDVSDMSAVPNDDGKIMEDAAIEIVPDAAKEIVTEKSLRFSLIDEVIPIEALELDTEENAQLGERGAVVGTTIALDALGSAVATKSIQEEEASKKTKKQVATSEGILFPPGRKADDAKESVTEKSLRFSLVDEVIPIEALELDIEENTSLDELGAVVGTTTALDALGSAVATKSIQESEASQETKKQVATSEGILFPYGFKDAKIFAYGSTLDELADTMDSERVLFGVLKTSLEEMMDDETYSNTPHRKKNERLVAFSIEHEGAKVKQSEVEKYKVKSHEVKDFCKAHSKLEELHPVVWKDGKKAKEDISYLLEALEYDGEEDELEEDEREEDGPDKLYLDYKKISISSSGKTAYKSALDTHDPADIPNGADILLCVRKNMGIPYNWVLFKPSNTELIVEDAGSGGVVELTSILQREYDDRVLFGLARVSFVGPTFGSRQIWWALEWTGENCFSVKMIRQLRDCGKSMSKMIGERSFTVTNLSAEDMTLEAVCERVKRSCDVTDFDLSVKSLKRAHIEEQKAIREYYEKMEAKTRARKEVEEERLREEERQRRLRLRREKQENMVMMQQERKERWSKMPLPELLEDLGKDSRPGWVLFKVEV